MRKRNTLLVVATLAFVVAAGATAARTPVVPVATQARIKLTAPRLAYAPTRMARGFRYVQWLRTPQTVQIRFVNRAGWEIDFVATPQRGSCRTGLEQSFQLDGNKVYWSHTGAEQQAWRCVTRPSGGSVRLVATSPQPSGVFAAVGVGLVVASGKRIG